jgi:hypothetical protein
MLNSVKLNVFRLPRGVQYWDNFAIFAIQTETYDQPFFLYDFCPVTSR